MIFCTFYTFLNGFKHHNVNTIFVGFVCYTLELMRWKKAYPCVYTWQNAILYFRLSSLFFTFHKYFDTNNTYLVFKRCIFVFGQRLMQTCFLSLGLSCVLCWSLLSERSSHINPLKSMIQFFCLWLLCSFLFIIHHTEVDRENCNDYNHDDSHDESRVTFTVSHRTVSSRL